MKLKLVENELQNGWIVWNSESDKLRIIKPSFSNSLLSVDAHWTIDADIKVRGLYNECQIPPSLSVVNDIRQLSLLLDEIMDHTPDKIEFWIKKATSLQKEYLTELENLDDVADHNLWLYPEKLWVV